MILEIFSIKYWHLTGNVSPLNMYFMYSFPTLISFLVFTSWKEIAQKISTYINYHNSELISILLCLPGIFISFNKRHLDTKTEVSFNYHAWSHFPCIAFLSSGNHFWELSVFFQSILQFYIKMFIHNQWLILVLVTSDLSQIHTGYHYNIFIIFIFLHSTWFFRSFPVNIDLICCT